jgi:FtsH-binding integral membrane protein
MTAPLARTRAALGATSLVTLLCAVVLIDALQHGALTTAACAGGAVAGVAGLTALVARRARPRLAAALAGACVVPLAFLWLMAPGAGAGAIAVGAVVVVVGGALSARP